MQVDLHETSNPYLACSSESEAGICPHADWSCSAENVAKTCSTFASAGGKCVGISKYPNATISEYGTISGADAMAKCKSRHGSAMNERTNDPPSPTKDHRTPHGAAR